MAGMPKRRARREAAARQALTDKAKAMETQPKSKGKYSDGLADQIVMMIADGTPIDDIKVGDDTAVPGIESKVGISAQTIYRWQREHLDFAEKIKLARVESADRIVDQCNALAAVALNNPGMAQAVKVASDILKWQASVRNRPFYGESRRIDLEVNTGDLGERLRRAKERVIDGERVITPALTDRSEITIQ